MFLYWELREKAEELVAPLRPQTHRPPRSQARQAAPKRSDRNATKARHPRPPRPPRSKARHAAQKRSESSARKARHAPTPPPPLHNSVNELRQIS